MNGHDQTVADDLLAAILSALGYTTHSEAAIRHSLRDIATEMAELPAMLVGETGLPTPLPPAAKRAELISTDGSGTHVPVSGGMLAPIDVPGYYKLIVNGRACELAVAPPCCPLPPKASQGRLWGSVVQIPSLRGATRYPYGHFGDLDRAVAALAQRGAGAVAINPLHAMFPGEGNGYSPYSPSSRLCLNIAMADPLLVGLPPLAQRSGGALIDWPDAIPWHYDQLRQLFGTCGDAWRADAAGDPPEMTNAIRHHALFDSLYRHFRTTGARGWQEWPAALHDPHSDAVRAFAAAHQEEIDFHRFTQWLASRGLQRIQSGARAAGMPIGLIADLAVGVDPGGSDAWALPDAMLKGLSIGAPPDPLGPLGQNWTLTSYSPAGLRRAGFAPWIAMVRAMLAAAGGVRIDHAFGLARLWVIPTGGTPADGAYLSYPLNDLVRLLTLEAYQANAIVIAENLGTSPPGFTELMASRRMLGMRVLPFERAMDHGYIGAHDYEPMAVAMTGTHDTATIAGWWRGRDLDWADQLGRLPPDCDRSQADAIRAWDRGLLWSTIGDGGDRPAPSEPEPVVAAALGHISRSPACLALAPLEDILALDEQPNLPGTTIEHPNWQRRLPDDLETLLADEATAARIGRLSGSG